NGRATSSRPTTPSCARWTVAAAPCSIPTPPRPPRSSSRCAASTTSATRSCCAARCRKSRRTSKSCTGRRPCRSGACAATGEGLAAMAAPTTGSQAGREPDFEAGATEFARARYVELAAVAAHHVLHDRQADAVAVHAFVAAHAALQHHRHLFRRDAGAIVVHRQQQARAPARRALARARGQQHPRLRPLERVLEQVAEQFLQVAGLAVEAG